MGSSPSRPLDRGERLRARAEAEITRRRRPSMLTITPPPEADCLHGKAELSRELRAERDRAARKAVKEKCMCLVHQAERRERDRRALRRASAYSLQPTPLATPGNVSPLTQSLPLSPTQGSPRRSAPSSSMTPPVTPQAVFERLCEKHICIESRLERWWKHGEELPDLELTMG